MAEMTKKALNKIKAAAFTEFKQGECKKTFPAGGRLAGRNGALNDKQRSGGRICK